MTDISSVLSYLPERTAAVLRKKDIRDVTEITLNLKSPVIVKTIACEIMLDESYLISKEDIAETMRRLSRNSVYAFGEEISSGYITLQGGHRAGICGKGIYEKDRIINISDVSAISVRVCREIKGCSDKLMEYICPGDSLFNVLIISPPGMGKTTLLRDIIRNLSQIKRKRIGIADERGEIAACHRGIPQVDIGYRSYVMEGMLKNYAMMFLLRAMSPDVIATDEIGGKEDMETIYRLLNSGVKVIATAHGYDVDDVSHVSRIVGEKIFERILVLGGGIGRVKSIYEGRSLKKLYGNSV